MADPILIVDDAPINRKLTQRILTGAGYDVRIAEDAETALGLMPELQPRLVLTNVRLPGMDGLTLTRRIKEDPLMRETLVIALTGCTAEEDLKRALEAGCDDYVLKPIDTRTFPRLIEGHLARRAQEAVFAHSAAQFTPADLPVWAGDLCRDFLREGYLKCEEMLSLGSASPVDDLRRSAHLWGGLAAMLGYPEITVLSRRLEEMLRRPGAMPKAESSQTLEKLSTAFTQSRVPDSTADKRTRLPVWFIEELASKRIAVSGFDPREAARVTGLFQAAGAQVTAGAGEGCELAVVGVRTGQEACPASSIPVLLVGTTPGYLYPPALLGGGAMDFASAPWSGDELLARACRLLNQRHGADAAGIAPDTGKTPSVVIADDDPTTLTLLRTTLRNYGMDCRIAEEGEQALVLIRSAPPDVAILDVIMPNMDGFEVLAAVRNDRSLRQVRVMLLTAMQQEADIVRGFALGADDYVLKPFSPVEVVARLKRLVRSEP